MKITKLLLCFLVSLNCFSVTTSTFHLKKSRYQTGNIFQKKISIYYKNSTLFIKGINGNGNLKVYSIIGNIISNIKTPQAFKLHGILKHQVKILRLQEKMLNFLM